MFSLSISISSISISPDKYFRKLEMVSLLIFSLCCKGRNYFPPRLKNIHIIRIEFPILSEEIPINVEKRGKTLAFINFNYYFYSQNSIRI